MVEENHREEDCIASVCDGIGPILSQDFGFFHEVGNNYVYPTNYPVRSYQRQIVHTCLFSNTLVSLPTGLGKTFIAAVVMLNYYRWFPNGKVVFTAPTRPLVAQQLDACYYVAGIPKKDTVQMTGNMTRERRILAWKESRVFFLTPQVLINDLNSGACPAQSIRCIVFDEAHKATKSYAYCQIMNYLTENSCVFRVLALSATPGSDIKSIINVVENLTISKVEFRTEESVDVAPYIHRKTIQSHVLPLSNDILQLQRQFFAVLDKYTRRLKDARILTGNVASLKPFQILKARERFQNNVPSNIPRQAVGALISDFFVCTHLAHAKELLTTYGIKAFYNFLIDDGEKAHVVTRLAEDNDLNKLIGHLCQTINHPNSTFSSHPKMDKLKELVFEYLDEKGHFECKLIIFCQYRSVVNEIKDLLESTSSHLIRPVTFVGQTAKGNNCGMTQNKQKEVLQKFRNGEFNVLIATSVAEEGLDIGYVDLIICLDCGKSPIRLVQRSGRTARHRSGQCIVLLTEGYEQQKFDKCLADCKSYATKVLSCKILQDSLRRAKDNLIPANVRPEARFYNIRIPDETSEPLAKKRRLIAKNSDDIFKYTSPPKKRMTWRHLASAFEPDAKNALESCEPLGEIKAPSACERENGKDCIHLSAEQHCAYNDENDDGSIHLSGTGKWHPSFDDHNGNDSINLSPHWDATEANKCKSINAPSNEFGGQINKEGHPRNFNPNEINKLINDYNVWSDMRQTNAVMCNRRSTTYHYTTQFDPRGQGEANRVLTDNAQFVERTNDQDAICVSPLTRKLIRIARSKVEADCNHLTDQTLKFHIADEVNRIDRYNHESSSVTNQRQLKNAFLGDGRGKRQVEPNPNISPESKFKKEADLGDISAVAKNEPDPCKIIRHRSKFAGDVSSEDLFLGDIANTSNAKKRLTIGSYCEFRFEKKEGSSSANAQPPSRRCKPSETIASQNAHRGERYLRVNRTPRKADGKFEFNQSPSIFETSCADKRCRLAPQNSDNARLINSQSPSLLDQDYSSTSQVCSLNDAMLLAYSEDDVASPFSSKSDNKRVRSLKPIRFSFTSSEDEIARPTPEYSETTAENTNDKSNGNFRYLVDGSAIGSDRDGDLSLKGASISSQTTNDNTIHRDVVANCQRQYHPKNREWGAGKFVLTEAEVCQAGSSAISSDTTDDDSLLDQLDSSFIDDDNDDENDGPNISVSMTSAYLQSVKSPGNRGITKFKTFPLPEIKESECSSWHRYYDESQYILDSFVTSGVDNDTHSEDELEKAERKLRRRQRRKRRRIKLRFHDDLP